MRKRLLCVAFFVSLICYTHAQVTDSLLQVLKTAREDSNKVKLLLSIGECYENTQPDIAKSYYIQSLQLSKKIGYKLGELSYASYYTAVLNMQGWFDSSLAINLNALQLAQKLNNQLALVKVTCNVANAYSLLGKNDSALYYYMQALPLWDRLQNKRMLAIVYNNLTIIYRNLRQYKKGIEYGEKAIPILRAIKDSVNLEYGLTNLGVNYSELKNYPLASAYFNEALQISHKLGDLYAQASLHLNLGDMDYQQERYEACKAKFAQALEIARELKLYETATIALKGFAMYYLQTKNYKAARHYADSALLIAQENNFREQRLKIYKLLAEISYASQDLKAANYYDIKQDELQDSINNDNLRELTTNFETKYETEKKEAQIKLQQAELNQKSNLNYFLIAGSTALLLILLLGYRSYRSGKGLQQAKIDELEAEKQLTATEAVLKGEEQERTRLAKDLHDGLGGMLSGIKYALSNMKENLIMTPDNAQAFERSIDMLDSSIKEMRRVAHNMMPEMLLKYGLDIALKEFCAEINRSGVIQATYQSIDMNQVEIGQTEAVTIYRVVQELVNNTIKHGNAKNVLVQAHIAVQEKLLAVTVEDDGKGFDTALLKNATGMGWINIKNRVAFLHGRIDIHSAPDKGTSVLIEINIECR